MSRLRELPAVRRALKSRYEQRFPTAHGFGCLCGEFPTFTDAARAVPPGAPKGYDTPAAAELYRDRLDSILPKDYPALLWLSRALPGASTLFDIGGHVGQLYYTYRRYLELPLALRWTVCDVPAVVRAGETIAHERGATALRFTTRLDEVDGADVVLASGSLQYIERRLDDLLGRAARRPRHVVVNQMPTHPGREIVTLQNIGVAICPYRLAARGALPAALDALGYELVDTWEDPTRRTALPYISAPESVLYEGYYFKLR